MFNKSSIDIISLQFCLSGLIQTQAMKVQKVGSAIAPCLPRFGGSTTVPPKHIRSWSVLGVYTLAIFSISKPSKPKITWALNIVLEQPAQELVNNRLLISLYFSATDC